ncbi:TniQ family protein [Burkholderia orbicola]|uniref:TniQ family protein n=2 Tax=Burkholderia TaxID=32008 RepID=UPI002FE1961E
MLRLPFVASPYPDEIFGSWLARVCLHNAVDGNSLLRKIGFTAPSRQAPFDILPFTKRVNNLCDILEIEYEDIILNYTTLSYRLTFGAAEIRDGYLPGTRSLPKLFSDKHNPTSVRNGTNHIKSKDRSIRYCPHCLLKDYQTYGEPYWHRSNQLPNIEHCPLHQIALRRTCPICCHAVLLQCGLLAAASLRCICGHDLTEDADDISPSDGQKILTTLSIEALNNRIFSHSFRQVDSFLRHIIRPISYEKLLSSAFGEFQIENGSYIFHSYDNKLITTIPTRHEFHRPGDCCAVLSASKIKLENFFTSIDEFIKQNHRALKLPLTLTVSIPKARELFTEYITTKHRPFNSMIQYRWYWLLRIFDQNWVQLQRPESMRRWIHRLPSIQEDREKINTTLHHKGNTSQTWHVIVYSPVYHRAIIRDGDWLATIKSQAAPQARNKRNTLSPLLLKRASLLFESLRLFSHEFGCPHAIRLIDLAKNSNLTISQARITINKHTELHAAFKSSNSNLRERQLRWALEQLVLKHSAITTSNIISKASLWRTQKISALADQIILEFKKTYKSPEQTNSQN